jgi:hypothetical protein
MPSSAWQGNSVKCRLADAKSNDRRQTWHDDRRALDRGSPDAYQTDFQGSLSHHRIWGLVLWQGDPGWCAGEEPTQDYASVNVNDDVVAAFVLM